jgi:gluconate 2-dehydrogenase gamma chain
MATEMRMDRRTFLAWSAAAALAGCVRERRPDAGPQARFDAAEWRTAEAALDRLLPSSPGAPGARDVRATAYVDAALGEGALTAREAAALRSGLTRLDETARRDGAADFAALPDARRDAAIEALLATADGGRWFDAMMSLALEAYLGDPVHGGNPDGAVWSWLGVRPGYPRPVRS